jgi:hypothetical protein
MRRFVALALALALCLSLTAPVSAASQQVLPAGLACEFALTIDIGDGGPQNYHEFANGAISAGRGNDLTFTNVSSGATLSLSAAGAVTRMVSHPDGSSTMTLMGHNVLILFPADVPAGPSTTLYIGRVVVDIDAGGNFTVQSIRGTATDVCAALS